MPADDVEARFGRLEREVAELRAHTQCLNALRETQLEQGRSINELRHEVREGFATTATGMAQITALLDEIRGPGLDGD